MEGRRWKAWAATQLRTSPLTIRRVQAYYTRSSADNCRKSELCNACLCAGSPASNEGALGDRSRTQQTAMAIPEPPLTMGFQVSTGHTP